MAAKKTSKKNIKVKRIDDLKDTEEVKVQSPIVEPITTNGAVTMNPVQEFFPEEKPLPKTITKLVPSYDKETGVITMITKEVEE